MIKRRILALILMAILFSSVTGTAEAPFTMMGLELSESTASWDAHLFFERMETLTGTSFAFDEYRDRDAYAEAKAAAFTSGDLPDVLFKAYLSPEEEMAWHASGQLVDLAPYLAEHAPNLNAILEARPDWKRIISQPDGAITSLPALNGAERQCCIWINQSWLDALSLDMPDTIDAFTDVLRAFRDGDPNGNGRQDEIPLMLIGPWESSFLLHAWGLTPNDYGISSNEDGTVRYAPLEDGFREYVAWLQMASEEGLLYADAFRTTHAAQTALQSAEQNENRLPYGCLITLTPYTIISMDHTTDYAVLPPLMHNGQQVYRELLTGVYRGTFAVTSTCNDIPAMLRWVDTLYTEEGGRLAFAGTEGDDYQISANGTWRWTSDDDYMRLSDIVSKSIITVDIETPGLEPAAFMRNSQISADAYSRRQTDTLRKWLVTPFPVTWPGNSEREARIAELQDKLTSHVDLTVANFAMGKIELTDETWADFQSTLRDLGAEEFLSLWQQTADELSKK